MKITTKSPEQTRLLGLKLAKKLKKGHIFALIGDLGGGKTELTKGLAKGLGLRKMVGSPTFVLMKVHRIKKGQIRFFCHVDAYRLKKLDDLLDTGLLEFLGRTDSVVVIEWADKIKSLLRTFSKTTIHFSFRDKHTRLLTITNRVG
jgi:tRNA threonylcarbamoyladenosine biosynthesis protein TsaE